MLGQRLALRLGLRRCQPRLQLYDARLVALGQAQGFPAPAFDLLGRIAIGGENPFASEPLFLGLLLFYGRAQPQQSPSIATGSSLAVGKIRLAKVATTPVVIAHSR